MDAFVLTQCDLVKLTRDFLADLEAESIICVGLYELEETELEKLKRADTIYFVASQTSMCSTAYQMLLWATFPHVESRNCCLLNLDNARIPEAFSMLRALPKQTPK
jgi:hypothetical protein